MQLDWETYGDFPISVEKTVEVNMIFFHSFFKQTARPIQLHDAHSWAYLIDRVDNMDRMNISPHLQA